MKYLISFALLGSMATSAWAVVFNDALNDVSEPMASNNVNFDMSGFEITNTLSSITFAFTVDSPDVTTNGWQKFNVIMRKGGGPLSGSNGWGRNYSLAGGADRFIGGWVDGGGGFEARQYDGANWPVNGATYVPTAGMSLAISGPTVSYTVDLATLGLAVGDTFVFDAVVTGDGGGHGAFDTLTTPGSNDWNAPVEINSQLSYTVVPEPATMSALGLGIAAMLRRRKKA